MIRCHAQQTDLHSDLTCNSRLAWLEAYEAKKRATLHSCSPVSEWVRAEEYRLCRRCKGIADKVVAKPTTRKVGGKCGVPKAIVKCSVCQEVKLTYAFGKCRNCYTREYHKKRAAKKQGS